jgi:hypothetical protein
MIEGARITEVICTHIHYISRPGPSKMICFLSWLTCQCECTFELEEDEAGSAVVKAPRFVALLAKM